MVDGEAACRSSLPSSVRERQYKARANGLRDVVLTPLGKKKIRIPDEEVGLDTAPDLVAATTSRYPGLATFSDENFVVYRRFGRLHARALLYRTEHEPHEVQGGQVRSMPDRQDQHNPFQVPSSRNSLQQKMHERLSTYGQYWKNLKR